MGTVSTRLTRQLDIIPMSVLGEPITVIGAGAIGSWTTLALAKMGFGNITVFDADNISDENMNCQFFPLGDIGKPKVNALRDLVDNFTGFKVEAINQFWEGSTHPGIVISAVDSMAVRKAIWEAHIANPYPTRAIIDPRMGAESALLYVMRPSRAQDRDSYKKTLHSDSEGMQERCTAKATIYTANMLSGLVCKAVKDLVTCPDSYLRVAQWDIAGNAFKGFPLQ